MMNDNLYNSTLGGRRSARSAVLYKKERYMALGEVYKVAAVGAANLNPAVTTWHFKMLSNADPVLTIGTYLTTAWTNLLAAQQSSDWSWTSLQIRRLSVPQVGGDYVTGYPIVGADGSGISDLRSSVVASLRTATLGRSYRGRQYLPGWGNNRILGGLVYNILVGDLQTIYDDIVAGVGVGGSDPDLLWGVWSAKLGNIPPPPGHPITGYNLAAGFQPITHVIVDPVVYTQRRRGWGIRIRD
jgi:hypothetical protein